MKLISIAFALGATMFASAAVIAQEAPQASSGHYEWQSVQPTGPRAPVAARKRVWIAEASETSTAETVPGGGRYEWRSIGRPGPRAGVPARKKIWVANAEQASANCMMMSRPAASPQT